MVTSRIIEDREELKTRELARVLAAALAAKSHSSLLYDLKNVRFMSRSFADEWHKQLDALSQMGIEVVVTEARPQVRSMLDLVATTQNRPQRPSIQLIPVRYNSIDEVFQDPMMAS